MQSEKAELLAEVAGYYSEKLAQHGETAKGVDWNSEASQSLRFAQLSKIGEGTEEYSLNDLGCGYGALYGFYVTKAASTMPASTSLQAWSMRRRSAIKVIRKRVSSWPANRTVSATMVSQAASSTFDSISLKSAGKRMLRTR